MPFCLSSSSFAIVKEFMLIDFVKEMFHALFDKLGEMCQGTQLAEVIRTLHHGHMADYLQCKVCTCHANLNTFMLFLI